MKRGCSIAAILIVVAATAMGARISSYVQPKTATVGDPLELVLVLMICEVVLWR